LTRFYGIKPADVDHMTLREVMEYRSQLREYQQQAEKGASRG
jgi:hypothetical protein